MTKEKLDNIKKLLAAPFANNEDLSNHPIPSRIGSINWEGGLSALYSYPPDNQNEINTSALIARQDFNSLLKETSKAQFFGQCGGVAQFDTGGNRLSYANGAVIPYLDSDTGILYFIRSQYNSNLTPPSSDPDDLINPPEGAAWKACLENNVARFPPIVDYNPRNAATLFSINNTTRNTGSQSSWAKIAEGTFPSNGNIVPIKYNAYPTQDILSNFSGTYTISIVIGSSGYALNYKPNDALHFDYYKISTLPLVQIIFDNPFTTIPSHNGWPWDVITPTPYIPVRSGYNWSLWITGSTYNAYLLESGNIDIKFFPTPDTPI